MAIDPRTLKTEIARLELDKHKVTGGLLQIQLRRLEIEEELARLDANEEVSKKTVIEIEGKLSQLRGDK